MKRVFVLSPARASGRRAQLITRPQAMFEVARQAQIGNAKLGDVFAFCSGLYFGESWHTGRGLRSLQSKSQAC